jgi:hypothetical protein
LKGVTRKGAVAKQIHPIKKKPSALHWDNGKDALRPPQKLVRPYPSQSQRCYSANLFQRLSREGLLSGETRTLSLPRTTSGTVSLEFISASKVLRSHWYHWGSRIGKYSLTKKVWRLIR